jgi:2-hydroxychromene-2-carboxylate isomerase
VRRTEAIAEVDERDAGLERGRRPDQSQVVRFLDRGGGKFDQCLDSGSKAADVEKNKKAGDEVGVTGTPAFFINGRLISGAQPLDAFKAIIDEELKGGK